MNALIGSGFWAADRADYDKKEQFHSQYWVPNVGRFRDIVIVDNSEFPTPKLSYRGAIRIIPVLKNLGHVGSFLGQQYPKLGGWSMSWILPALMAYCESRDFIYQEADCLAFGEWEKQIYADMEAKGLLMAFGDGSTWGSTEQSLFLIKSEFILTAIKAYVAIEDSDGVLLPENKFEKMERENPKIGRHSLLGGRNRPLPMNEKTFYGQKFTSEELDQLKIIGLV
jgi:hypothetical protein